MITHPEKVLFPSDGITKADLAAYYSAVAPHMLPHVRGRPVTLERYPAGIGKPGFIQKDVSKGFPEWLERVEVPKKDGTVWHALINDAQSLLWTANQNCITPHVWSSRVPELLRPDICVFDLDPSIEDPISLRAAALAVRDLLEELGLPSWVKTSGSKGFHIVVPLDGSQGFDTVATFAHGCGALLVKRHADRFTQEFIKADRDAKILIDTGRNHYSATFAAAYAVRARPLSPVSAPCTWQEIEQGQVGPTSFRLSTMQARLAEQGELWRDLHAKPHSLAGAMQQLQRQLTEADWSTALSASRRKPASKKSRVKR